MLFVVFFDMQTIFCKKGVDGKFHGRGNPHGPRHIGPVRCPGLSGPGVRPHDGTRYVFVHDPDGNLIELAKHERGEKQPQMNADEHG